MKRTSARISSVVSHIVLAAAYILTVLWLMQGVAMVARVGWQAFRTSPIDYLGNEWWRPWDVQIFWIIIPACLTATILAMHWLCKRLKRIY